MKLGGTTTVGLLLLNPFAKAGTIGVEETNGLIYDLQDGWVDNWLLAGPQLTPIADARYKWEPALRGPIMQWFRQTEPLVSKPFVEGATFTVNDAALAWRYYACPDDHLVDLAAWYGNSRFVRVWAYVEIVSPDDRKIDAHLFANGPSDVWLNGNHAVRTETFDYVDPMRKEFSVALKAGANAFLVRQEMPASLNTAMSLALRVVQGAEGLRVRIPVEASDTEGRQALETAFLKVSASQDIYTNSEEVRLLLPQLPKPAGKVSVDVRQGNSVGRKASWDTSQKPTKLVLGKAGELTEGSYRVVLSGADNQRELSLRILKQPWHSTPPKGTTYERRRKEVLEATALQAKDPLDPKAKTPVNMWNSGPLRGELAKMELGRWKGLHSSTLVAFIEGVAKVEDGSDFRMLDLLGMQIRYGKRPEFPAEVTEAMKKCALGFRYWADEPGQTSANYFTENHRLAFHASEVLAGQLYSNEIFSNNGKTGDWHRQHGEQLALEWLYKRGQYGFEEWDANGYLAADIVLLTHLADLAQNPQLKSMAKAVTDKIFLGLAVNSFKGSFGSTHGRTGVDYVKDSRNEPIAPLAYLGWGLGIVNSHVDETVAVACANYRVPAVIQSIALHQPAALWSRERTGLDPAVEKRGAPPVDKVTYKTPDFMLASAQSWRPGEAGYQHHIWQATLGPDAPLFVTHPACISENGNRRPNFWMGNQTLPRVAQWKDALVALHQPRAADWLQWSHAYFPTFAFDEYKIDGTWAFARVGNGYAALTAANGLALIEKGTSAFRELRSTGGDNVWICQMGSKTTDGDFAAFQSNVKRLPVAFEKLSVKWTTLRGQQMQFGWTEPLLLDGNEQPISNFPHFDTPYAQAAWPAKSIEVKHKGEKLVLDFGEKS